MGHRGIWRSRLWISSEFISGFFYYGIYFTIKPNTAFSQNVGLITLSTIHLGDRELLIISVAFALGIGVTVKPEILNSLPEALKMILSSGISTGTLAALILNVVPKDKRKEI